MTLQHGSLTVTVVVPVYNGGSDFGRCMAALAGATPPPDEIVVVADGESDGSWRMAQATNAKIINVSVPGGPAKARNLGARQAKGDILFFVDADVAVAPDAIGQIKTAFQYGPDLAALFGSYDDRPGAPNFISQFKNLFHHYTHQTGSEDASTFWSGCGAIRRDIFLAMGGFDVGYPYPCIEDIELGYRLKQAGHRIRLHKALQGTHLKRWTAVSLVKTDFLRRALPWTELILRDRQVINDLNLGGSSRASVMLVFLLLALLAALPLSLLAGGLWGGLAFTAVVGNALALLALNWPVYRFFWRKRGGWFALRVIPWHWFYYFYGGVAFAVGAALVKGRQWGLTTITYLPANPARLSYTKK
jgi:GT2 family glycosyltransferase